jgi:hypothetical protein
VRLLKETSRPLVGWWKERGGDRRNGRYTAAPVRKPAEFSVPSR